MVRGKNCGESRILPAFTPQPYTILYNTTNYEKETISTTNDGFHSNGT